MHEAGPQDNYILLDLNKYRVVTDQVMGGVSTASARTVEVSGKSVLELRGLVSTENNGGFVQLAFEVPMTVADKLNNFLGVRVKARGNGEQYNLHLRTSALSLPWQSFRASFDATEEWRTIEIPFSDFVPYKTSAVLDARDMRRIGVVAIGRNFDAGIEIGQIGFYR